MSQGSELAQLKSDSMPSTPCLLAESLDSPQHLSDEDTTWPYATAAVAALSMMYAIEVVLAWLDVGHGLYMLEGISGGCIAFNNTLYNPIVGGVQEKGEWGIMAIIFVTSALILGLVLRSLRKSPPKDLFALVMFEGILFASFLMQLAVFLTGGGYGPALGFVSLEVSERIGW